MSPSITKAEQAMLGRRAQQPTRVRASRGATARDTGQAKKRARRPEKAIQRAILDFLATIPGIYAFKTGTGMFPMTYKGKTRMVRMGQVGVADIVGWRTQTHYMQCCPPHFAQFLAIEVKRRALDLTLEQSIFLERVRQAGGIAFVATSVDDVVSALGLNPRGSAAVAAP